MFSAHKAVHPNDAVPLGQVRNLIAAATSAVSASAGTSPTGAANGSTTSVTETRPQWASLGGGNDGGGGRRDDGNEDAETAQPGAIVAWANVDPDGSLSGARSVAGQVRHSLGNHEIAFERKSLRQCTFNATLGKFGFISVKPGEHANSVTVEARNHLGALTIRAST